MKEEKKLSSEIKYDGRMITLTYDTVELENGHEGWREVVRHPGASAILVFLDDGRILLEKQYRYALEQFTYEMPAGKLDPNEDPLACAKRELKEETGYEAKNWKYLGPIHTSPGFCDEVLHIYMAKDVSKGTQNLDDDEFVDVQAYTMEEVWAMIERQELSDAKTLAALTMAWPYYNGKEW